MANLLQDEVAFFDQNSEEFLRKYKGRFLLIKGAKLVGHYPTRSNAVTEGVRRFGKGPFLVRVPGEEVPVFAMPSLALGLLQGQGGTSTHANR